MEKDLRRMGNTPIGAGTLRATTSAGTLWRRKGPQGAVGHRIDIKSEPGELSNHCNMLGPPVFTTNFFIKLLLL